MAKRAEPETATIVAVAHDGRGIAAPGGKKVFVPGALSGETVRIRRRKFRRQYDEAELLEVLGPSPARVQPRCAVFGICGACSLQHLTPADQRAVKQQALADSLERIGSLQPAVWLEPLGTPADDSGYGYRRRARLAVKDVPAKRRVLVGFRERHAPFVTDMHRCEVLAPPVDGLIDPLSEMIATLSIRARLPQIEVAVADADAALVFRVLDAPTPDDEDKLVAFARTHGVRIALQTGGLDTVRPLHPVPPPEPLTYALPEFDVRLAFEPTDFVQVNARVNRLMVAQAVELLDVAADHRVLDLYCGIGNFSLPLARHAGFVLGIEGEQAQVERAAANARRNDIANAAFRRGDLAAVDGREDWIGQQWDRVLLDPPRSGAPEVVRQMGAMGAPRVVCVSCHPATLARDAAVLAGQGYRLEAAGVIDMFPHTAHAEAMAVFSR